VYTAIFSEITKVLATMIPFTALGFHDDT